MDCFHIFSSVLALSSPTTASFKVFSTAAVYAWLPHLGDTAAMYWTGTTLAHEYKPAGMPYALSL